MKNKDDKQASFEFDRPSKVAIIQNSSNSKASDSVIRIAFSNIRRDGASPTTDVYAINRRILDLVK